MEEYFYYDTLDKGRIKKEIAAIYSKGYIGQPVILDNINFGDNPDLNTNPIAAYPMQSIFTIVNVVTPGNGLPETDPACNGSYLLSDPKGNIFKVCDGFYGASCGYLYDAQEWLDFKKLKAQVDEANHKAHVQKLEGDVKLLSSILSAPNIINNIAEFLDKLKEELCSAKS